MLPCYVVLDLETTGGNAQRDRITEIAAVRIENGVETARWSTLVNPGVPIPGFIQMLTGITHAMVAHAPRFAEVAIPLLELLDGAVFVAHNVRFDHAFVVNELARMERVLKTKTLCTVRLSRQLYPGYKGHGLDAIIQRHGLQTQSRHRAMGDVDVVLQWLALATAELGEEPVAKVAQALLQGSASLPPLLETPIADIPNTPGVYLFYGAGALPLYIGKSVNLRTRVLSHFQAASKVAKEMRILSEICRVEWIETAGELGALLLEARLIKEQQPVYNRRLRREKTLCTWQLLEDPKAHPMVKLVYLDAVEPTHWNQLYGTYRSKRQALDALRQLAQTHGLCPRLLGLESSKGACFAAQMNHCKGACVGREPLPLHRVRLQMALAAQRLQAWPHPGRVGVREYHAQSGRTDIHIFDQWCHVATIQQEAELDHSGLAKQALSFDLDTYRLLSKRLSNISAKDSSVFPIRPNPVAK
ncbi:MAG: exonuclease domain-containing protein [Rhodoferax sp.]|nr:exonuclease domain-containing protein [Rhodoferax sp.]